MREVSLRMHLIIAASIIQCNYRAPKSDSYTVWCSLHPTRKSLELSSKAVAPARLIILGFILATAPVWRRQPGSSWRRSHSWAGVGEGKG